MRCSRTQQGKETKAIISKIKKDITSGVNWKEAIKLADTIEDSIQREKAKDSIIDFVWKNNLVAR